MTKRQCTFLLNTFLIAVSVLLFLALEALLNSSETNFGFHSTRQKNICRFHSFQVCMYKHGFDCAIGQ